MAMTKKDYVLIANTVNRFILDPHNHVSLEAKANLAYDLAEAFESNPRFDFTRFVRACLKCATPVNIDMENV